MIHSIPLVLVDNKQDKQTIYYNIILFSLYIILMNYLQVDIYHDYVTTAKQFQNNPSINNVFRNILFTKYLYS